ncbi:hypothetical protein [Microcystis aeruginosa]|uniref:Uncharacterized protein n=1 Tax=Microcystis aeruginosa NIES-3807 TaxID=2517785 RepID=A0AAD3GA35_MICAE|nr:hypothetical protein [Microcystis aeruginosa]GCL59109.1 hypothetical protein NIES3807_22810 [Microcystis aeruginosa NIES-3807]
MSSFEDLRKIQARQQQEEARKLEAKKRLEAESRENQYRYNQARERAERARQSFLLAQEAQNNRILYHFSSLVPEILDEFGQLIYGTRVERKVEYTRGFLGIGSSEIVREIPYKNYHFKKVSDYRFELRAGNLNDIGIIYSGDDGAYSIELKTQRKQFIESYLRLENGIQKSADCSHCADFIIEFCKICYYRITLERMSSVELESLASCYIDPFSEDQYKHIVHEDRIKDMIKLQRLDIEKALTEIWQAKNKYA